MARVSKGKLTVAATPKSSKGNAKVKATLSRPGVGGVLSEGMQLPYDAASLWKRGSDMPAFGIGGNSSLVASGAILRARSRDLYRQNSQAYGAIESLVAELIGSGIRSLPATPDRGFNKELKQYLDEEVYPYIDADGVTDIYGMQRRLKISQLVGGDVILQHLWNRGDRPYQVRGLESEYLPYEDIRTLDNGNKVLMGVEIDKYTKQRVALHLLTEHPDDWFGMAGHVPGRSVRVPANLASLLYWPARFGDLRGEPTLVRSIIALYGLDMYRDAELRRKNQVSKLGLIFKRSAQTGRSVLDELEEDQEDSGKTVEVEDDLGEIVFEPGTSLAIENDEEAEVIQTPDVGGNYIPFLQDQERMIAKSLGLLVEHVNGDWSQTTSDRVLKAGLAHTRRHMEQVLWTQDIPQCVRVMHRNAVSGAIISGAIKPPRSMSDDEAMRAIYVPQKWEYLHPVQEEQARKLRIDMGMTTITREAAAEGEDAEEIDEERALELARHRRLGLQYERSTTPGLAEGEDQELPNNRGIVVDDGAPAFDPNRSARRIVERGFKL